MTESAPDETTPRADIAGASVQRRYDQLNAKDQAARLANRRRSWRIFLIGVVAACALSYLGIQLLNKAYDSWRSSLPGQVSGGPPALAPTAALLLTALITVSVAMRLAATLWGRRQTTENYRIGAEGERATAARLVPLADAGWVLLHDRTIPGRRENIDHLTVGPTGVAVIDAKNWAGRVVVRPDRLTHNGRDKATVLAQLERQARAVTTLLRTSGIETEVRKVVCFHRAEVERTGGSRKVPVRPEGVRICGPRQLAEAIQSGPQLLTAEQVTSIGELLDQGLKRAVE